MDLSEEGSYFQTYLSNYDALVKKAVEHSEKLPCESPSFTEVSTPWDLFMDWMEIILSTTVEKNMRTSDFYDKFSSDLSNSQIMNIVFNNSFLPKIVKLYVGQGLAHGEQAQSTTGKDLEKSRVFLSKSLCKIRSKAFTEALNHINQAILFSPFPSMTKDDQRKNEQLSFCLMTRANILTKLTKFSCEMDIEDFVCYSKSDNRSFLGLASTLTRQFEPSEYYFWEEVTKKHHLDFFTSLYASYENINGAIEKIDLNSNSKSRALLAGEKIPKSLTRIIAEDPISSWMPNLNYSKYCFHCFKVLVDRFFPCRNCITVFYCSSICSEQSWDIYHSEECQYLPILRYLGIGHLVLRTLMTYGAEEILGAYQDSIRPQNSRTYNEFSKKAFDIFSLSSDIPDHFLPKYAFVAQFLARLACSMKIADESNIFDLSCSLFKLLKIISCNTFLIADFGLYDGPKIPFGSKIKETGMGFYATSSLLRHSDDPNCDKHFINNKIVIFSRKTININEELTIKYGETTDDNPFKGKRWINKFKYDFKCDCNCCRD